MREHFNATITDAAKRSTLTQQGQQVVDGDLDIGDVDAVVTALEDAGLDRKTMSNVYAQELGALRKM